MKRLCTLSFLFLGQFASAQAGDVTITQTMRCVRTIAESMLGGREGLTKAAGFIDSLATNASPLVECEQFADSTPYFKMSRRQQIEFIQSSAGISPKARSVLTNFITPKATCSKIGLSAQAGAWVLGLSAKLDGASCSATNGRVWLELSPGVGWIMSEVVLSANVNKGTLEREIEPLGAPVDFSPTVQVVGGMLVTLQLEDDHYEPDIKKVSTSGIGLGLGGGIGFGGQLNFALIPMGTDDSILMDTFSK